MLITASDISRTVQVVESTEAHTARRLLLMLIYFYYLSRNFQNLSFQNNVHFPPYFGSHSTNDFCKGCFKGSSGKHIAVLTVCRNTCAPRWHLNSPVELLKIAPASLQNRTYLSSTECSGTVQCPWKSQREKNTKKEMHHRLGSSKQQLKDDVLHTRTYVRP